MNSGSQSSGNSMSSNPMTSLRKRRLEQYARFKEEHSSSSSEEDEGSGSGSDANGGSDKLKRVISQPPGKKPKSDTFDILLQAHNIRSFPGKKSPGAGADAAENPPTRVSVKKETSAGAQVSVQVREIDAPDNTHTNTPTSLGPRKNSVPKDDKLLQKYQQTGALDEVFGSQSVLSQELISLKHHPFPSPETYRDRDRAPRKNDIQEISAPEQSKSPSPTYSPQSKPEPQLQPQPQSRPPSASQQVKPEQSQMSISVSSLPDLPFSQSVPQSIPQSMPYFSSQLSHISALNDDAFLNAAEIEAEMSSMKPPVANSNEAHKPSPTEGKPASNIRPMKKKGIPKPPSIEQMKQEVLDQLASSHNRESGLIKQANDNPSGVAPIEKVLGTERLAAPATSANSHICNLNTGSLNADDATPNSIPSNTLRPYSVALSDTTTRLSPIPPTITSAAAFTSTSTFPSTSPPLDKLVNKPISREAAGPHNPEDPMLLEMAELAAQDRRIAKLNPGEGFVTWVPIKTKKQRFAEEVETKELAAQAAKLVAEMAVNRKVEKQLLLSMTLSRESPRTTSTMPPPGNKLKPGFHWGHFPPLEKLLRSHMEEYYELSIKKCQSTLQQEFNNRLVKKTQYLAYWHGWAFEGFTDRELRDRIRCFFKTHIQNAKKRLKTMIKNPAKKANAKALVMHFDLIQKHNRTHQELQFANDYMKDRGKTFQTKNPDVKANLEDKDAAKVLMQGFRKKVLSLDEREF